MSRLLLALAQHSLCSDMAGSAYSAGQQAVGAHGTVFTGHEREEWSESNR